MDAASGAQVSTVRGAAKRAFGWTRAGVRLFILSLIGALIVVVAREWDWWVGSASLQSTDDAYLRADTTPLAAKVPGYVRRVLVQDFQRVRAGNVLVEIVDDDYRAQLDQAQANVSAAEAAITNIDEQRRLQETLVKQAEAEVAGSEADETRYHLEAVRQQTLISQGIAGTPQLVEQAIDNSSMCWRAKRPKASRASQRKRPRKISQRSTWATRAYLHRSRAWSASAKCGQASISASGRR